MAAAESLSVSQAEIILMQGTNTAMKTNGAIAGDPATGQKKFTARQWGGADWILLC